MDIELQSRIARTFRAWSGLPQSDVAAKAGVSERTLLALETGRSCSAKTWEKVAAFYEAFGLSWRGGDPGIIVITR